MTKALFYRNGTEVNSKIETLEEKKNGTFNATIVVSAHCKRCGGSGRLEAFSYIDNGRCFTCDGANTKGWTKDVIFKVYTAERIAQLDERREKKRAEKKALKIKTLKEDKGDLLARFEIVKGSLIALAERETKGDFFRSIVNAIQDEEALLDALTENRVLAYEKAHDRHTKQQEEQQNAETIKEGRYLIEGEVVSTKTVETHFGISLKMLVKDGEGYKYWGTVPSSLIVEKGDKVSFTAKVKASSDDKLFGFYSRPTKAQTIEKAEGSQFKERVMSDEECEARADVALYGDQ